MPLALGALLVLAAGNTAFAKPASGPGKVAVGLDVSVWDSGLALDLGAGIFPVGGAGQLNGEFTTAERLGIQIGLRAQERFVGPLEASPNQNRKIGIYQGRNRR
jgi:hypothetical protein